MFRSYRSLRRYDIGSAFFPTPSIGFFGGHDEKLSELERILVLRASLRDRESCHRPKPRAVSIPE